VCRVIVHTAVSGCGTHLQQQYKPLPPGWCVHYTWSISCASFAQLLSISGALWDVPHVWVRELTCDCVYVCCAPAAVCSWSPTVPGVFSTSTVEGKVNVNRHPAVRRWVGSGDLRRRLLAVSMSPAVGGQQPQLRQLWQSLAGDHRCGFHSVYVPMRHLHFAAAHAFDVYELIWSW